jgi:hypothetical protein
MSELRLPSRDAIEAYMPDDDHICLKQENTLGGEPSIICIHSNDVSHVIEWLKKLSGEIPY